MASKLPIHLPALADADKCTVCAEDGRPDELADVGCAQCQRSLCSSCVSLHSPCNKSQVTMAVKQITNGPEVLQAEDNKCSVHGKQLELVCFDCRQAKCTDCVRECKYLEHAAPQLVKGPQSEALLADTKESIKRLHMQVLGESKKFLQSKNLVSEVQSARAIHLDELKTKKKYAMDSLSESYAKAESSLREMHDRLEESAPGLQCLAEQLEQSVQHASKCVNSLIDMTDGAIFLEQLVPLMSRLEALSEELDGFKALTNIDKLVTLNGSLPENMNEIVASWVGSPELSTDLDRVLADALTAKAVAESNTNIDLRRRLHFNRPSGRIHLPFDCSDVSVTSEGHVLLAARGQGMREYKMSGLELSSWRPPAQSDGHDDEVMTVAALDDGRAVVGVCWSRLLVLLQLSCADRAWLVKKRMASSADRAWLVERRVAELLSPPRQLSVLGDLVAVALLRRDYHQLYFKLLPQLTPGPQLQLVRLSSGQLVYSDTKVYDVGSVALTAAGVVTASYRRLVLNDREVYVVDCCSHRGERLWRHALNDDMVVGGVWATSGRQLLACMWMRRDRSKDCVRAIDKENGMNAGDVLVNSRHGLKLPMRLCLARGPRYQQVLAVLSKDDNFTSKWNKVTVHEAVSR